MISSPTTPTHGSTPGNGSTERKDASTQTDPGPRAEASDAL